MVGMRTPKILSKLCASHVLVGEDLEWNWEHLYLANLVARAVNFHLDENKKIEFTGRSAGGSHRISA